ncbi:unnamed protein product, partial [Urochloa humidicola]
AELRPRLHKPHGLRALRRAVQDRRLRRILSEAGSRPRVDENHRGRIRLANRLPELAVLRRILDYWVKFCITLDSDATGVAASLACSLGPPAKKLHPLQALRSI